MLTLPQVHVKVIYHTKQVKTKQVHFRADLETLLIHRRVLTVSGDYCVLLYRVQWVRA